MNKYFPYILHVILAGLTAGLAWGLHHTPNSSMVAVGMATGCAIALGITCFIRLLDDI